MKPERHLASERHERGVQALAALLNHWLGRSNLSHDQLIAISSWGMGESSPLHKAVISRSKNGRQARGMGLAHLDALAAANHAIWRWQQDPQQALQELGPFSTWKVDEQWLQRAVWLPQVEDPQKPLAFRDLAEVLAGHLELPYLVISHGHPERMGKQVGELLEQLIAERGWGPREAREKLLAAYPVTDLARQRRLKAVIVGEAELSADELEGELYALAEMIRTVRGVRRYGPADLQAELLSGVRSAL